MIAQRTYHRLVVLLAFSSKSKQKAAVVVAKEEAAAAAKEKTSSGGGTGKSTGTTTGTASTAWRYYFIPVSGPKGTYTGKDRNNDDVKEALNYRRIHGILAALAFLVLFPVGGVIVRIVPARFAALVHGIFQGVALCVWLVAAGLGIMVVNKVKITGGGLLQHPSTNYHPIIGLVLLGILILQPIFGVVHHVMYRSVPKRQVWSYLHLFTGRVGITLGIVNGYLGLYISSASGTYKKVYIIVGAVMWVIWMGIAVWSEWKKAKEAKKGTYVAVSKAGGGEEAQMTAYTGYK
ncbi:hypothetical protein N0V88_002772 [Collariella sp. IMI 366227]|nr:hypothetical protein N0V88_002772 [Collariella sp. IMI 366227]